MLETFLMLVSGSATLWTVVTALLLFLVAIAVGVTTIYRSELAEGDYRHKLDLMPNFEELRVAVAALGEKRKEQDELREELRTLNKDIALAQRHQLDAQHWQSIAEQAKRDYDSRQDLVAEVERLRTDYEDAAKDLATRNQELADRTRELSHLNADIKELEEQQQRANDLTNQLEALGRQREELLRELDSIKDHRDERLRAAFDVGQLVQRREELEQALQSLPDKVNELESRRDTLNEELNDLHREADRLREARDERDRLQGRHIAIQSEIEALGREKARLETELSNLARKTEEKEEVDGKSKIEDLLENPNCLFNRNGEWLMPESVGRADETEMLLKVESHLRELGLHFDQRVLYRFHTSLKTGFISPLTVLAGISGTGKSQLPQRYAEAMGMHFLKVAVQPRWDSPQDLLGFYNYLEKSYKATEFSRALVRMDGTFEMFEEGQSASDRVLLVLLDEMNLARVEYYFSEFLSRLEGRPESDTLDPDLLLPGRIDIDVPGRDGEPLSFYPGHNVLFAGTMNEDESTQALSDKVLDRANTLRFPKPEKLFSETIKEKEGQDRRHLPYKTWNSWRKHPGEFEGTHKQITDDFIGNLNDLMAKIHRPFGHRVNQAIHAYVANYPGVNEENKVRDAIADMVELRILPKLRGMDLEGDQKNTLTKIAGLVKEDLNAPEVAERITQGMNNRDNVFRWIG